MLVVRGIRLQSNNTDGTLTSIGTFIKRTVVLKRGGGATHLGRLLLVHPYELLAVILNPTEFLKNKIIINLSDSVDNIMIMSLQGA